MTASDLDGDPISFQIADYPAHGQLTRFDPATGAFNKAVTFGIIEPLYFPNFFFHEKICSSLLLSISLLCLSPLPAT